MSASSMIRWLGLLGGLTVSCHDTSSDETVRVNPCATHRCETFYPEPGAAPTPLKGAMFEVREFGFECSMDVSWSSSKAAPWYFRARVDARRGEVFPLRDGLVELVVCQGLWGQKPGHTVIPYADVVVDPDASPWPALAPDNVFIPLSGYALINDVYAAARLERVPDGGSPSPSVSVVLHSWPVDQKPCVYDGLRDGNAFRWGELRARVVHIVHMTRVDYAREELVGWVEVSLSRRDPVDAE